MLGWEEKGGEAESKNGGVEKGSAARECSLQPAAIRIDKLRSFTHL